MAARPDGTERERYKDIANWTFHRWAWEFLRRSKSFVDACEKVDAGTMEEKDAADSHGLAEFKHYKERYGVGAEKPKFSGTIVRRWGTAQSIGTNRTVEVNLAAGEALFCFDLSQAIQYPDALNKQLRIAQMRLEELRNHYAASLGKVTRSHKHKTSAFGIYIRLLDGLADGKNNSECYAMLNPIEAEKIDRADISGAISKQIKAAKEYASIKYIHLSTLPGRPKNESFRSDETHTVRRKSSVD